MARSGRLSIDAHVKRVIDARGLKESPIDMLRIIESNSNATIESFNQSLTASDLIHVGLCCIESGWDVLPHDWTVRQVARAKRGIVPTWDDDEKPTYDLRLP